MTINEPNAVETLALAILCPRCKARPKLWCLTGKGYISTYLHTARISPMAQAFAAGYEQGQADELSAVTALMASAVRHPSSARATDPWRA